MNTKTRLYRELLIMHRNHDIVISPEYLAEIALYFETLQNTHYEKLHQLQVDMEFNDGMLSLIDEIR